MKTTPHHTTKLARRLRLLTLALPLLFLVSCSGGDGGGASTTPPPLKGTITGQSRVVTNQIYTYTGAAASGAASNYSWAWGDGSTGSTNASSGTQTKTWHAAGNYTASLSFTDSANTTASISQAVAVIDHPISSGAQHSCAILSDNTVACWGQNNAGQLGNSANVDTNTPVVVPGLNNVISLAAHGYGTCVAKTDGGVWCWGGYGFTNTPQQVAGVTNVVALASTWEHVCALQRAGTVKCFGNTAQGALGDGVIFHNQADPAVQVSNLTDAVSIATGGAHTCAIKADQTVVCWGNGTLGAVGPSTSAIATTPVAVAGVNNAMSLALGEDLSCAVITDGSVMCWGNAGSSLSATYARAQGLTGNTITTATPQVMPGINNVVSMSIGRYHACALKTNNTVECWGTIGGGTTQLTPVVVMTSATETLKNVQAIGSGWGQTCAIKFNGAAYCWGSNSNGQLGNATTVNSTVAQLVLMSAFNAGISIDPISDIAAGAGFTCALKGDTSVACWSNAYDAGFHGELGNSASLDSFLTPVTVSNVGGGGTLTGVSSITAGGQHACALKSGAVVCWGDNAYGQLGNGSTIESNFPVAVTGLSDAIAISTGSLHTCALKVGGTVACWGIWETYYGSIQTVIPLTISGLTNATAISNGAEFSCALKQDASVMCWGFGSGGVLGDGNGNSSGTPVNVTGLNDITAITTGGSGHSCAVKNNGAVVCWGKGGNSQLSSGGIWADTYSPVAMGNIGTIRTVAAGYLHTCALRIDSTVTCWGTGEAGQLGDGNGISTPYPSGNTFDVSGLTNVSKIAAGKLHNCAVKLDSTVWSDSTVWCWGDGYGNVPVLVAGLSETMPTLTFWK
jgi:alpha-tubulin suppressor-like RCC1 family protein